MARRSMKNVLSISVVVHILTVIVMVGCTTSHYARIMEFAEDQEGYLRIAGILSRLLPKMVVVDQDKYGFFISDDEELNAFALSQYTIVVNRGLLHAFDDKELTCVLAHEIAHITLGHNEKRIAVENSRYLVFSELKRVAPDAGLLSSMIKPWAINEYSKEQETEADIEAVGAIRRIGLFPGDYTAVLRKLQESAEKTGRGSGGGLWDDHPSTESRIEKIEKMRSSDDR